MISAVSISSLFVIVLSFASDISVSRYDETCLIAVTGCHLTDSKMYLILLGLMSFVSGSHEEGGQHMGVFRKQGVYWIDYYVNGHRRRERIGPDKRLAETVY
jgi:hypothetical protein